MFGTPPGPEEASDQESVGTEASREGSHTSEGSGVVLDRSGGQAEAKRVDLRLSATRRMQAQDARLRLSAVGRLDARRCALQLSAAGVVYGHDMRVGASALGATTASTANLSHCRALLVAGRYVSLADSRPLLLLASSTEGQVRPMLDARSAAALGAMLGLALGAATLLRAMLSR